MLTEGIWINRRWESQLEFFLHNNGQCDLACIQKLKNLLVKNNILQGQTFEQEDPLTQMFTRAFNYNDVLRVTTDNSFEKIAFQLKDVEPVIVYGKPELSRVLQHSRILWKVEYRPPRESEDEAFKIHLTQKIVIAEDAILCKRNIVNWSNILVVGGPGHEA